MCSEVTCFLKLAVSYDSFPLKLKSNVFIGHIKLYGFPGIQSNSSAEHIFLIINDAL